MCNKNKQTNIFDPDQRTDTKGINSIFDTSNISNQSTKIRI